MLKRVYGILVPLEPMAINDVVPCKFVCSWSFITSAAQYRRLRTVVYCGRVKRKQDALHPSTVFPICTRTLLCCIRCLFHRSVFCVKQWSLWSSTSACTMCGALKIRNRIYSLTRSVVD